MVKEAVDVGTLLSAEEVGEVVARWGLGAVVEMQKLYGGFSGSNYRVRDEHGVQAVLKVCHSYGLEEVCAQAAVVGHLGACQFPAACAGMSLLPAHIPAGGSAFVTCIPSSGEPAMLLTFCEGKAADSVIESGVDAHFVLREVGVNLARLHQVPTDTSRTHLRSYTLSGACNIGDHLAGKWKALFRENEHTCRHSYVDFYERRVDHLSHLITLEGIPCGIIHGDPFLDNILVEETTGSFKAFVDFEDACVGPLLFDVACCAAAACYKDNALDITLLASFLRGYTSERRFTASEEEAFIGFMQMTLLCNGTWRFKNFNIDHRELEQCRNKHVELQDRIVGLDDVALRAQINQIVLACRSQ